VGRTVYEALLRRQERSRTQVVHPATVEEALQLVHDFETRLATGSHELVKPGVTLTFDSPVDFNRFIFEMTQAKASVIKDVHVFEGRYHVTVTIRPKENTS
jgi:hypothetical protein